jgi:4-hydroxybenzoate polyprenyltransferase
MPTHRDLPAEDLFPPPGDENYDPPRKRMTPLEIVCVALVVILVLFAFFVMVGAAVLVAPLLLVILGLFAALALLTRGWR